MDIELFNTLYAAVEHVPDGIEAKRQDGYYILLIDNQDLWRELFLYGQYLAQELDADIDGSETPGG